MGSKWTLGTDGHLTSADMNMIHAHFACIIKILAHAGLDRPHIYEFLLSQAHLWWFGTFGL